MSLWSASILLVACDIQSSFSLVQRSTSIPTAQLLVLEASFLTINTVTNSATLKCGSVNATVQRCDGSTWCFLMPAGAILGRHSLIYIVLLTQHEAISLLPLLPPLPRQLFQTPRKTNRGRMSSSSRSVHAGDPPDVSPPKSSAQCPASALPGSGKDQVGPVGDSVTIPVTVDKQLLHEIVGRQGTALSGRRRLVQTSSSLFALRKNHLPPQLHANAQGFSTGQFWLCSPDQH